MVKRKIIYDDDDEEQKIVENKKPSKKIKFETLPPINSIKDLITIGKTYKYYHNIDVIVLWDILPHLEELDNMIGMSKLKESLFYQIIYYLQGMHKQNLEGEYLHTIITGAPGTGKTTVAKIMSKIYQKLNILGKGNFRIAHREDFVGQYLGETALKTKKLLTSCIGGVLFVDEVYSLGPGQKDKDSYSKEAIDTLNAFLSEHKNDFCMIGAGYKEDIIKCFFSVNKGLERRFAWVHHIDNYTDDNLVDILLKMVNDINWKIDVDKKDILFILNNNKDIFKNSGGSCENFISKCKLAHSKRVFGLDSSNKFIINKEDMNYAIQMLKSLQLNQEEKPKYDYYT